MIVSPARSGSATAASSPAAVAASPKRRSAVRWSMRTSPRPWPPVCASSSRSLARRARCGPSRSRSTAVWSSLLLVEEVRGDARDAEELGDPVGSGRERVREREPRRRLAGHGEERPRALELGGRPLGGGSAAERVRRPVRRTPRRGRGAARERGAVLQLELERPEGGLAERYGHEAVRGDGRRLGDGAPRLRGTARGSASAGVAASRSTLAVDGLPEDAGARAEVATTARRTSSSATLRRRPATRGRGPRGRAASPSAAAARSWCTTPRRRAARSGRRRACAPPRPARPPEPSTTSAPAVRRRAPPGGAAPCRARSARPRAAAGAAARAILGRPRGGEVGQRDRDALELRGERGRPCLDRRARVSSRAAARSTIAASAAHASRVAAASARSASRAARPPASARAPAASGSRAGAELLELLSTATGRPPGPSQYGCRGAGGCAGASSV